MLNKNRMMVFKNKGKDQEVSKSSLLLNGEVTEFLARYKLSVGESRRSHVRCPARCHFSPLNSCVRYTSELLRFPPDFFLSLFFLPFYLFLPLIFFYPFCFYSFFLSALHTSLIAVLSLNFRFSFPSLLFFFLIYRLLSSLLFYLLLLL